MNRRARTPLALAAIALALAAYIALGERGRETTDQKRAARVELLPGFDRAQTREIEIDGGSRGQVKPAHADELLDALAIAEIDREATIDAKAAGLEPPRARLLIGWTGQGAGRQLVLDIGAMDPSGRGVYVHRGADPRVLVTGKHLRDLIERELGSRPDGG